MLRDLGKTVFIGLTACVLCISAPALASKRNADRPWYLGLGVMLTDTATAETQGSGSGDSEEGLGYFGFRGVAGYKPAFLTGSVMGVRLEAEYAQRTGDVLTGIGPVVYDDALLLHSLMGNVYLDVYLTEGFTPFIGAGYGVTRGQLDVSQFNFNDTTADELAQSYQLMLGFSFGLAALPNWDWTVTGQHFETEGELTFRNGATFAAIEKIEKTSLNLDARYSF